jgi:hypothetical protein
VTSEIACGHQREYMYTFCLEKVMSVVIVIGFSENLNVKSATVMIFPAKYIHVANWYAGMQRAIQGYLDGW